MVFLGIGAKELLTDGLVDFLNSIFFTCNRRAIPAAIPPKVGAGDCLWLISVIVTRNPTPLVPVLEVPTNADESLGYGLQLHLRRTLMTYWRHSCSLSLTLPS